MDAKQAAKIAALREMYGNSPTHVGVDLAKEADKTVVTPQYVPGPRKWWPGDGLKALKAHLTRTTSARAMAVCDLYRPGIWRQLGYASPPEGAAGPLMYLPFPGQ